MARVAELRRRIREADETVSDWDLRDWWDDARFELRKVRLFGDLVIGAFFEGSKPKERKAKREEYAGAVFAGGFAGYQEAIEQRRRRNPPLAPFHWEIEFPEVFERVPGATGPTAEWVDGPFAGVRRHRRQSAVCGEKLGGGGQRRPISGLAEAGPHRDPRQCRPRGSLLPTGVRPRP